MEKSEQNSKTIKVPWNFEGNRLDIVAQSLIESSFTPALSRVRVREAIEEGLILVNGVQTAVNLRVSKGDMLLFTEAFFEKQDSSNQKTYPAGQEPEVLENNEYFIALYKPPFWLTHGVSDHHTEGALEDWLLEKGLISSDIPLNGRVHRLDRNTSGVIVYAKTEISQQNLKDIFKNREIEKNYIALSQDHFSPLEGEIIKPIMRKKGSFKRIISLTGKEEEAKYAETTYRVIATLKGHDLVLVSPKTGRTHQIRVHLKAVGHPIAGDDLYGGSQELIGRQFLHAWALSFRYKNKRYHLVCPLAPDLKKAFFTLDEDALTSYDDEALLNLGLKRKPGFFLFIQKLLKPFFIKSSN